ncbi:GNAT family N-acetyltransferase [Deinococcus hopiensis]|uniref:Protein N-acetyltransferase, RimJ/RimL family n=1 Tax=Deinococcus hopiensis KR-140 TaxID=695939 RepID=A0A1W1VDW8_9DEIO|nr:GNAT family protein [Deinococcus hopiensis]SMB91599.1 Protein N-acetyltransferase, RimJ/RimL family [Deinococcus hopiensis KR-140]
MAGISLRPLRPGDEDAAVRWAADAEFCLASGWTPGLAPRVVRQHWARIIAGGEAGFVRLGVELEGRLIGYTDLGNLSRTAAEWGIGIGERAQWGRGIGREVGRQTLTQAFETLELRTVRAEVHVPNVRSHALMRRLGFRQAGFGTPELYRGEVVEVVRYAVRREDWAAVPGHLEGHAAPPFA